MSDLTLEALPDLPQCKSLLPIARALWQQQSVLALWLGGSLASGKADPYSDIDLRLSVRPEALQDWKHPDFTTLFEGRVLAQQFLCFGEHAFLHHLLLDTGDLYDLWVQSAPAEPASEPILLLGCRDETLAKQLRQVQPHRLDFDLPADPETIRQALAAFWINTHKHRKVLHRQLHLLVLTGLQLDRAALMRLWYVQATGRDPVEQGGSIHSLTHLTRRVEQARGSRVLAVLGAPLTSREQIYQAIEQLRNEVARVGKELAQTMGFEYPHALEQTVRQGWAEFRSTE